MKIGIIGASLAGLVAGDKLARAGHDVTVIEKDRELGGRLATRKTKHGSFDYGQPFLRPGNNEFAQFIEQLTQKGVLHLWAEAFSLFDGTELHGINPNRPENKYFASREGVHAVAEYLKRWVDVKRDAKASGITYIGSDRGKKRAWMINLTDISVFECDAVILATPAPQAYGIMLTAQDETPAKRIIRVIDEIQYQPRYALMASYSEAAPDWKGIECEGDHVRWISHESTKQGADAAKTNIVIQSSAAYARNHYDTEDGKITEALLERAGTIAGDWLTRPDETQLHFWKYFRPHNPIDEYFMEMEMEDAPLALIGDYFNGQAMADAYISGHYLADYWIDKYAAATAEAL